MDSVQSQRRGQLNTMDLMAAADVLMAQNERIKCALREVFSTADDQARAKVPYLSGCKFCSSIDDELLRELRVSGGNIDAHARWILQSVNEAVPRGVCPPDSEISNLGIPAIVPTSVADTTAQFGALQPITSRLQRSFEAECERYIKKCFFSLTLDREGNEHPTRIQSELALRTAPGPEADVKAQMADVAPRSNELSGAQPGLTRQASTVASQSKFIAAAQLSTASASVPDAALNAARLGWSVQTELFIVPPLARLESALRAQSYKCPSCGAVFSNLSSNELRRAIMQRFCEYSNAFFCGKCFGTQRAYVPARILCFNDYRPVSVSSTAYYVIRTQFNTPQFSVVDIERSLANPIRERVRHFAELHAARVRLFFLLSFVTNCTAAAKSNNSAKANENSELYTLLNDRMRIPAHFILQNLDAIRRVRFREYELFMDDPEGFVSRSAPSSDNLQTKQTADRPDAPGAQSETQSIRTTLQLADECLFYSIGDIVAAKYEELLSNVQKLASLCVAHVTRHCYLCKQKGYLCEVCHADEVLYPFNVPGVIQCAVCYSCFHTSCIEQLMRIGSRCPRCVRLERRASSQRTREAPSASDEGNSETEIDTITMRIDDNIHSLHSDTDASADIDLSKPIPAASARIN